MNLYAIKVADRTFPFINMPTNWVYPYSIPPVAPGIGTNEPKTCVYALAVIIFIGDTISENNLH